MADLVIAAEPSLAPIFATWRAMVGRPADPSLCLRRPVYRPGAPLRLGLCVPVSFVGGVERWAIALLRELRASPELGVHPAALCYVGDREPDAGTAAEFSETVPFITARRWSSFDRTLVAGSPEAAAELLGRSCDVVVCWSLWPAVLERLRSHVPRLVGVSHGCADWWMREADGWIDAWIAVSRPAAEPLPRTAFAIVENGIEIERLASKLSPAAARRRFGVQSGQRAIAYVGRFSREKRLDLVTRGLALLPRHVRGLFVGRGDFTGLTECAAAAGRVLVSPPTPTPGDVYRAASCAICASEAEGFGLSALEALWCGSPLISTPVGILPELERRAGGEVYHRLSPTPTPEEVADVAAGVLRDPREAAARVARARQLIATEYTARAMAARWARCLRAL